MKSVPAKVLCLDNFKHAVYTYLATMKPRADGDISPFLGDRNLLTFFLVRRLCL